MLVWAMGLPAADFLIGPLPPLVLTAARMGVAALVLLPLWLLLERGAARRAPWAHGLWIGGVLAAGAVLLVPFMNLLYRPLLYITVYRALWSALSGRLARWNKLRRLGLEARQDLVAR